MSQQIRNSITLTGGNKGIKGIKGNKGNNGNEKKEAPKNDWNWRRSYPTRAIQPAYSSYPLNQGYPSMNYSSMNYPSIASNNVIFTNQFGSFCNPSSSCQAGQCYTTSLLGPGGVGHFDSRTDRQ